jgi:proline iminopeptidase
MKDSRIIIFVVLLWCAANGALLGQGTSGFVLNGDVRVHYEAIGEGKPILLLSGGPGFSSAYVAPVAIGLSKSFRSVLVDQRGTGKSNLLKCDTTTVTLSLTIDDLELLRKHLGYDSWIVLGHSYGGLLASAYAAAHPKSVSALVLVGTAGLNTGLFKYFGDNINARLLPSDNELSEYWSDSAVVARDSIRAKFESLKAILPGYFFSRKNSLLLSQTLTPEEVNFDINALIWHDIGTQKLDLTESSWSYKNPVLIVHGRQDPIGESVPQIAARAYPNSKLVFIERCGHFPWLEQPATFYSTLIEFLDKP